MIDTFLKQDGKSLVKKITVSKTKRHVKAIIKDRILNKNQKENRKDEVGDNDNQAHYASLPAVLT